MPKGLRRERSRGLRQSDSVSIRFRVGACRVVSHLFRCTSSMAGRIRPCASSNHSIGIIGGTPSWMVGLAAATEG